MFLQDLFRLFRIVYIVFLRSGIRVPEWLCFIHVARPHRKAIGPIGCRHDFLIIKCIADRLTEPLIRAEPFFMIDDRCNGPLLCGVNRDIVQTGNPVHIIRRKIKDHIILSGFQAGISRVGLRNDPVDDRLRRDCLISGPAVHRFAFFSQSSGTASAFEFCVTSFSKTVPSMICLAIKYCFYQLCLIFLSYIYIYFTFLIQLFIAFSLLSRQSPRSRASADFGSLFA